MIDIDKLRVILAGLPAGEDFTTMQIAARLGTDDVRALTALGKAGWAVQGIPRLGTGPLRNKMVRPLVWRRHDGPMVPVNQPTTLLAPSDGAFGCASRAVSLTDRVTALEQAVAEIRNMLTLQE